MGWKIIMWPKLRMGLPQEVSAGLNAKPCDQITPQISTSQTQSTPNMNPINGCAQIMEQQNNS